MIELSERVADAVRWLASNSWLEVHVVPSQHRRFKKDYQRIKGHLPDPVRYSVAINEKVKGGNEIRLIIPIRNERYRSHLVRDLGLTQLPSTQDGRGWRKGVAHILHDLLALGFDIGRYSDGSYPHDLDEVNRAVGEAVDQHEEQIIRNFFEGNRQEVSRELALRNAALVREAKRSYPVQCCVCGFDFGKVYGSHGKGFIEAHHLKPVAQYQRKGQNATVRDVRLVCSNCHRMLHRGKDIMALEALQEIVKAQRRKRVRR